MAFAEKFDNSFLIACKFSIVSFIPREVISANTIPFLFLSFICEIIEGIGGTIGIQPKEDASARTFGKPSD